MDPFLQAKYRQGGSHLAWGKHPGYVEDVYRTYKGNLPQRDPGAYNRALQFRENEKAQWRRTKAERDDFEQQLLSSNDILMQMTQTLSKMTTQFSSLKLEHERANSSSGGTGRDLRVPEEQNTHIGPADSDVARDVLVPAVSTEVLPNPRGQASEHGTEGRHGGRGDTAGDIPICESTVCDGGEGESRREASSPRS